MSQEETFIEETTEILGLLVTAAGITLTNTLDVTGQYLSKYPIKKENKKDVLVCYIWDTLTSAGFLAAGRYPLYRLKWATNLHAIQWTVFSKCLWPGVGFFQRL